MVQRLFTIWGQKLYLQKANRQSIKTDQNTKKTAGSTDQPRAAKIRICWRLLAKPHDTVLDL
jgi:hypothetical protein